MSCCKIIPKRTFKQWLGNRSEPLIVFFFFFLRRWQPIEEVWANEMPCPINTAEVCAFFSMTSPSYQAVWEWLWQPAWHAPPKKQSSVLVVAERQWRTRTLTGRNKLNSTISCMKLVVKKRKYRLLNINVNCEAAHLWLHLMTIFKVAQ